MDASNRKAAAVAAVARAELARRNLLDFARQVYPGWTDAPHLTMIADLLERVDRGELKRLMVNLPPRHAKSTTCTQIFPAWYLGRHPRDQVIMATHSVELSERNSRGVRALVVDDRWPFEAKLSEATYSASRWSLTTGGGVFAAGVESSITGRGANKLILDDAQHDEGSPGERDAAWRWYTEVATPRLEPGAAIVAIGTRFAEDDLFGRILAGPDASEWTVVRLPALAEEGDPLGRAPGAALWPERIPVRELLDRKRVMGSRAFESQFQQNPVPLEGNVLRAQWLSGRYGTPPESFEKVVMGLDAAAKTGIANDYSALVTIGVKKNAYFVLDVVQRRVEFPDLVRMVEAGYQKHKPSAIYVEDASNAVALIQQLKRDSRLPIVPVKATGSKISRVEGVTGTLEAGKVLFPGEAPWLTDFERELLGFPNAKHDDQVDAFVLALSQVAKRRFTGAIVVGDGVSTWCDSDGTLHTNTEEYVSPAPSDQTGVANAMRRIW